MTHPRWRFEENQLVNGSRPRGTARRGAALALIAAVAAVSAASCGNAGSASSGSNGVGGSTGASPSGSSAGGNGGSSTATSTSTTTGSTSTTSGTTGVGGKGTGGMGTGGIGGGTTSTTGAGTTSSVGGGCVPNQPCDSGLPGVCTQGTTQCMGAVQTCTPVIKPKMNPEKCNGQDDNCDGMIDEGDPGGGGPCMASGQFGICKLGIEHCVNGAIKCMPGAPQPEVCNGLDDNCDGLVDNGVLPGVGMQCDTGFMGVCKTGLTTCDGTKVVCTATIMPLQLPESCNGLDDNCDGMIGVGIPEVGMPCMVAGMGICQYGTYDCPMGAKALVCNHPAPQSVPETCNGKDDDCNGIIDDPGQVNGLPCTVPGAQGPCANGKTLCMGGSSSCIPNVMPQMEICNGIDDNCDGQIDNIANVNGACASQLGNAAANVQTWACTGGNCAIVSCANGHADIDMAAANGCECMSDANSTSCAGAGVISVAVGGTATMTGVVSSANGSEYAEFSFVDKGVGVPFHPKVELTGTGMNQYAMDVYTDCNNNTFTTCGPAIGGLTGSGTGAKAGVWEQSYPSGTAGEASDNTPHQLNVWVRIYRAQGDTPTCTQFTVTGTNP